MDGPRALGGSAAESGSGLHIEPMQPVPERLAVGAGTALFLDGLCSHPDGPTSDLRLSVDGVEHPTLGVGMPRPGGKGDDYWWAIVPIEPVERRKRVPVRLRARVRGGEEAVGELGTVQLEPTMEVPDLAPVQSSSTAWHGDSGRPAIAVGMATWEAPIDLFRRQIDSIREQTYENWLCVISDDCSSSERLAEMRAVLGDDERFLLAPSPRRLGFYANFERALALAPPEATYVALCDQDDRWYPDKLEVLAANMSGGTKLAYSDMRIVDREGRVAYDTYWSYRRNNHENFGSLLMANTVTGAASLFDRGLLDYALPFPPRYWNAYHDHWIALVALALGEIAYVDRPLYDYVQHTGAVIGHARANRRGWGKRPPAASVGEADGSNGARVLLGRLTPQQLRRYYFEHYCGTSIIAKVLDMRCGPLMTPTSRRTVQRFLDPVRALGWLLARSPGRLSGNSETLHREQTLLLGLLWRWYAEARKRVLAVGRTWSERSGLRSETEPVRSTECRRKERR